LGARAFFREGLSGGLFFRFSISVPSLQPVLRNLSGFFAGSQVVEISPPFHRSFLLLLLSLHQFLPPDAVAYDGSVPRGSIGSKFELLRTNHFLFFLFYLPRTFKYTGHPPPFPIGLHLPLLFPPLLPNSLTISSNFYPPPPCEMILMRSLHSLFSIIRYVFSSWLIAGKTPPDRQEGLPSFQVSRIFF